MAPGQNGQAPPVPGMAVPGMAAPGMAAPIMAATGPIAWIIRFRLSAKAGSSARAETWSCQRSR